MSSKILHFAIANISNREREREQNECRDKYEPVETAEEAHSVGYASILTAPSRSRNHVQEELTEGAPAGVYPIAEASRYTGSPSPGDYLGGLHHISTQQFEYEDLLCI